MLKFKKMMDGTHQATHKNGDVVIIEKMDSTEYGLENWRSTHEGDFNGDWTLFAKTKRELVEAANHYEVNM